MKITVYSKQNCGGCDFTKNWLDENNLEYTAIDVTEDEQALADLKLHGFMSVPVVTVDGLGITLGQTLDQTGWRDCYEITMR